MIKSSALLIVFLLAALPCGAATVSVSFSGEIYDFSDEYIKEWMSANSFYGNETVTGTLTYDPSLFKTQTQPNPATLYYFGTTIDAATVTFELGGKTFTGNDAWIQVVAGSAIYVNFVPTTSTSYFSPGYCTGSIQYASGVGSPYPCASITLTSPSVVDTSLPTSWSSVTGGSVGYFDLPMSAQKGFYAPFLSGSATPEPATGVLLGSLAAGWICVRLTSRRRNV